MMYLIAVSLFGVSVVFMTTAVVLDIMNKFHYYVQTLEMGAWYTLLLSFVAGVLSAIL